MEGNFSAPFGGFSVDFCNMNAILKHETAEYVYKIIKCHVISINLHSLNVIVQPSVSWMTLNEKLVDTGYFFPIDPGPSVKAITTSKEFGLIVTCRLWLEAWLEQIAGIQPEFQLYTTTLTR